MKRPTDDAPLTLASELRQRDSDRLLSALLAPVALRLPLMALFLVAAEIARVPQIVQEPMAGLIRLQWWREALADAATGKTRGHPALAALAPLLAAGVVNAAPFERMAEACELEIEGAQMAGIDDLERHVAARDGPAHEMALAVLDCRRPDLEARAVAAATASALLRVVEPTSLRGARGLDLLPRISPAEDVAVSQADLDSASWGGPALVRKIVERAERLATEAAAGGQPPRAALPALYLARLAIRRARRLRRQGFDPFRLELRPKGPWDAADVLWTGLTRRL